MIDPSKLVGFSAREKLDYYRGVERRLVDTLSINKSRARELCELILCNNLPTHTDIVAKAILENSEELAKLAISLISDQNELAFVGSAITSVREKHYQDTNEHLTL